MGFWDALQWPPQLDKLRSVTCQVRRGSRQVCNLDTCLRNSSALVGAWESSTDALEIQQLRQKLQLQLHIQLERAAHAATITANCDTVSFGNPRLSSDLAQARPVDKYLAPCAACGHMRAHGAAAACSRTNGAACKNPVFTNQRR